MRPDGFSGLAVLITTKEIHGMSTSDFLEGAITAAGLDQPQKAAATAADHHHDRVHPWLAVPARRTSVERTRRLHAPVLVSANALSLRPRDAIGIPTWRGFNQRNLRLVHEHPVHLDSAGFVAAMLYNGFEFTVDAYIDLCAAASGRWFASMDMCVEPEIARDEETVRDRIAGTVRLNRECLLCADDRGFARWLKPFGRSPSTSPTTSGTS
jgi:hypothetical protein